MQKGAITLQKTIFSPADVEGIPCNPQTRAARNYLLPFLDRFYGNDGDRPAERQIVHTSIYALPASKITALHFHDTIELGFCDSGDGECHTENGVTDTFSGDVELFFPYETHMSRSKSMDKPSTWKFVQIELAKLCQEVGYANYSALVAMMENDIAVSGIISRKKYPRLAEIIRQIVDEAVSDRRNRYEMTLSLLCELLILDTRLSENLPKVRRNANPKVLRLKPALDYVNCFYSHDISIEYLAELCHMSITQLRACFRETTGSTPKEYITRTRIHVAELYLTSTDHTILEIALETGFGDVSGFYRAFVAKTGVPPSDYRKKPEKLLVSDKRG